MGRKQTCQPAQLLVQATNRHSDLMLKSGPLSGPLLRFTLRLTPYKATIICEVRRPLLGTKFPPHTVVFPAEFLMQELEHAHSSAHT
jgi:hypothetical protein